MKEEKQESRQQQSEEGLEEPSYTSDMALARTHTLTTAQTPAYVNATANTGIGRSAVFATHLRGARRTDREKGGR